MNHKDDGNYWVDVIATVITLASFYAGYSVRDSGYVIDASQPQKEIQAK
jgi:hypothetical protein